MELGTYSDLELIKSLEKFLGRVQCDQISRIFVNILPFATMKICRMEKNIGQSRLKNFAKN